MNTYLLTIIAHNFTLEEKIYHWCLKSAQRPTKRHCSELEINNDLLIKTTFQIFTG